MTTFTTDCRSCPRLAEFLDQVRIEQPTYHALPVSSFGAAGSPFLIVGLAPGMHGANRTGRPFTGDYAGNLLYGTLHKYGFASAAEPLDAAGNANSALHLKGCRITNAVRCLPPQNKPEPSEIRNCNGYLAGELAALPQGAAVMALGTIAHQAVLTALGLRKSSFAFAHGARHELPGDLTLYDSYHCSRYNTQTRRLTTEMFEAVVGDIAKHLER
ncbi:uracil-DNA glycosylase [Ferrigenium kumadai]|uniref:Type-5 uracil-DNA glycosylase n=1 Tax=Ferrigenium kumadai TaxID=1682490 RepID=A0AAN1VZL2_9PROT|nr:uracil-DNA glycosylase [Ferrigenium kumadai]BBI99558.1 uracil-DNA glycosylase [Ferrigenium kumadai]